MKNRNHVISIINIWKLVNIGFLALLVGAGLNEVQDFIDLDLMYVTPVVVIVVYLYFCFYLWFKTTYEIKEDAIVFQKFLRFKITKEIMNYNRISSLNASSKLIYRIFKVSKVSITSNTNVGNESDSIDIIISNRKYEELKTIIDENKDNGEVFRDDFVEYSYGLFEYLAYTAIIFIPYLFGIIVAVAIIYIAREYIDLVLMLEEGFWQQVTTIIVGVPLGLIIRALFMTRHAINLNVVIYKARMLVNTSSKFISESEIEFNFDKIKVMKIHTFKLFKRSRVGAGVVNSLEVGKEVVNPTLSCLLTTEKSEQLISELDVDCKPLKSFKPKKIRVLYNLISFVGSIAILTIALVIAMLMLEHNIALYVYLILLCIVISFFIFKTLAIIKTESCGLNDTQVIVSKRYYENIRTIFSYDNIQMVSITQSIIDRIFNVYNVKIGIFTYSATEDSRFVLRTYSKEDCDKIVDYIDSKINDKNFKIEG